jgi:hypothetical protein
MKLKATKYLLPTTDGRLHKELSYLISLHENKMNKGKLESRISDLENKVNEMSHALSMMCDRVEPIEDTDSLFAITESIKDKFNFNTTPTPEPLDNKFPFVCDIYIPESEPITSTTLKTPNEWLKLMSDDEVKLWRENRQKSSWTLDVVKEVTFRDFINCSFAHIKTPQGEDYWQNLSNRYNY